MEKQKITFVSNVPHLSKLEECVPKPMQKSVPDWWKKTAIGEPYLDNEIMDFGNVKNCPSFPDYFSQGYVVTMWSDVILDFDRATGDWFWKTPSTDFIWEIHPSYQFLDLTKP
jgi:hypothetical protein